MFRDSDDSIVFIDFGAVKEVIAQSTNSQSSNQSTLIYSGGYTPVEQFKGKTQFNSDIYALGMTALEALTGENPQQLKRDNNGKVISPQQLQVSKELFIILQKMVDEDYQKRYQSAKDVKDVLDALRECRNTSPWLEIATLMFLVIGMPSFVAFVVPKVIQSSKPNTTTSDSSINNPTIPSPPNPVQASSEPGTSSVNGEKKSVSSEPSPRQSFQPLEQATSSNTNQPGADNRSPIRFIKVPKQQTTPTSPLVEPLSTPSFTKDSHTKNPIKFKRAKPNKILPSP